MRFQKDPFSFSSKAHRSICVHTTVLMRFRLSTLQRSKTIDLHVVTQVEHYVHVTNTRACDILQPTWYIWRHRFHFDAFSTVRTDTICMRFRFDLLSRAFSNRCVFDENAQRIWVWTGTLWFLQFAGNQEIKSRLVHCSLSLLRLSRPIAPSPTVTNDFSNSVFLSLDKWKAWIYNNTRICDKIWDTAQARNCTGYQFMTHRLKRNIYNTIWSTIKGKQTRENNKKRINGIIIIVIISDLCATFRATSDKT